MERLTIHEQPPLGASPQPQGSQPILPGPPGPPVVPQLPPQMFTTAASLLDLTDSKILLVQDVAHSRQACAQPQNTPES